MKSFIGLHQVVSADDYIELALGAPVELWLGVEGESDMERAAREDAARDILADHPHLVDDVSRIAAEAIEAFAPTLGDVAQLARATTRRGRAPRTVAA